MGGEIDGVGAFKLEVEGVGAHTVDSDAVVERVVGEILHVGPEDGGPFAYIALDDEAEVVDVAVTVAVEHHVGIHQMQRVDIAGSTS